MVRSVYLRMYVYIYLSVCLSVYVYFHCLVRVCIYSLCMQSLQFRHLAYRRNKCGTKADIIGTTQCSSTGSGLTCWRAALWRGTWVSWWMTGWPWASSVPWLPRKPMASWGALGGVWPAGQGRFFFPSPLPWWGPIWYNMSISGLPSSRKMRSYWRESNGGLRGWWGDWSISSRRRGWGSWACSAWRREGWKGTF